MSIQPPVHARGQLLGFLWGLAVLSAVAWPAKRNQVPWFVVLPAPIDVMYV